MRAQIDHVIEAVRAELEPTSFERQSVEQTFSLVRRRIITKAVQLGIKVSVEEVGSVGKDTWIRGEADLDAFIIFPETSTSAEIEKFGLKLGRYAAGRKYIMAYAEHPYVRARVKGLDVDIVPCVGVKDPSHIVTAVDRTPFHKQFVIEHLNRKLREGVRLLKRFMHIQGIYGAEIRVRGFSGYLAELLVINYGGFTETLKAATDWNEGLTIDIKNSYSKLDDVRAVFPDDPLIVVDPVDRRRNVAAAVTPEKMAIFVSSAREFIDTPSALYFKHVPRKPDPAALSRYVKSQMIPLIGMRVGCPRLVPDILWGQLHKSLSGLVTLFARYGFEVVYSNVWSDGEENAVFLFELKSLNLSKSFLHKGPTVYMKDEATRFLNKHADSKKIVAGPWIEENRWLVLMKRETTSAEVLLRNNLNEARIGAAIEKQIARRKRIETGEGVIRLAAQNRDFLIFAEQFLKRRPLWLEWTSKHRAKST